jgi:transcriptional repressor NrdR
VVKLKCPFCSHLDSKVLDSRPTDEGSAIRRRRECLSCQKRFTTYEKFEEVPIMVVKKDNAIEIFDRNKIIKGLIRATQKRPISINVLEQIVDDIENSIYNDLKQEVTSIEIGEMVMERLKKIDSISYVRFASVYKEFSNINTFMEELKKLI